MLGLSDDGRVIGGALSFGLDAESVVWFDGEPFMLRDYLRANGVPDAFEGWINTGFVQDVSRRRAHAGRLRRGTPRLPGLHGRAPGAGQASEAAAHAVPGARRGPRLLAGLRAGAARRLHDARRHRARRPHRRGPGARGRAHLGRERDLLPLAAVRHRSLLDAAGRRPGDRDRATEAPSCSTRRSTSCRARSCSSSGAPRHGSGRS